MAIFNLMQLVTIGLFLSKGAYAGAGAYVQACLYTPTAPIEPYMASFTAGGSSDQCMNSKGVSSSMVVTKAGVNCADVSYVEGKDSTTGLDNCAIKDSVWTLSYSTNSTGDSGSTQSVWQSGWLTNNKVTLQAYTKGTNVCSSKALCSQNIIRWSPGTTGPLYFVFDPTGAAAKLLAHSKGDISVLEANTESEPEKSKPEVKDSRKLTGRYVRY